MIYNGIAVDDIHSYGMVIYRPWRMIYKALP